MTNKNLSASTLRKYNLVYENQYDKLSDNRVIDKFITKLDNYIDADLKKEGCTPQYFLSSLALVGSFATYIYHGSFPKEYESELIPIIKQYIVRKFGLTDFDGFILKIYKKNSVGSYVTIKLQWNEKNKDIDDWKIPNSVRNRRRMKKIKDNQSRLDTVENIISKLETIESKLDLLVNVQKS